MYQSLGMRPLHVRKEVPGFIADRLLEALWREALHLVNDGVATTGEIDDAIRFGAGLRWSFMGTFLTYTLAGAMPECDISWPSSAPRCSCRGPICQHRS